MNPNFYAIIVLKRFVTRETLFWDEIKAASEVCVGLLDFILSARPPNLLRNNCTKLNSKFKKKSMDWNSWFMFLPLTCYFLNLFLAQSLTCFSNTHIFYIHNLQDLFCNSYYCFSIYVLSTHTHTHMCVQCKAPWGYYIFKMDYTPILCLKKS